MGGDEYNSAVENSTMDLEPLSSQAPNTVNFEQVLYQTLVNDGEHIRLLDGRRPPLREKQLPMLPQLKLPRLVLIIGA